MNQFVKRRIFVLRLGTTGDLQAVLEPASAMWCHHKPEPATCLLSFLWGTKGTSTRRPLLPGMDCQPSAKRRDTQSLCQQSSVFQQIHQILGLGKDLLNAFLGIFECVHQATTIVLCI
eukprot:c22481_g1_i1 orf=227-580(+)